MRRSVVRGIISVLVGTFAIVSFGVYDINTPAAASTTQDPTLFAAIVSSPVPGLAYSPALTSTMSSAVPQGVASYAAKAWGSPSEYILVVLTNSSLGYTTSLGSFTKMCYSNGSAHITSLPLPAAIPDAAAGYCSKYYFATWNNGSAEGLVLTYNVPVSSAERATIIQSAALNVAFPPVHVPLAFLIVLLLFLLLYILAYFIAGWVVLSKSNRPGWSILVPFYGQYQLTLAAGLPTSMFVLSILPVTSLFAVPYIWYTIALRFGRTSGFALFTALSFFAGLSPIPLLMLALGSDSQGSPGQPFTGSTAPFTPSWAPSAPFTPSWAPPALSAPPAIEVGWHLVGDDPNTQAYFDGNTWARKIHWDGSAWQDAV